MIKFFRHIRQSLIMKNQTGQYFKYAIGEIILVVIGILIALQINNWNENRKNQKEQYFILNKLQTDIVSDINYLEELNTNIGLEINNYIECIEILGRKKDASKEEFMTKFGTIFGVSFFNQNATTFNNLVSSGKLELISNKLLSDDIVNYYTDDYKGWDTALRDYTRNFIGPYLLKFDHIPQMNLADGSNYSDPNIFYRSDVSSFDIKPKTLDDYRKDLFIINALRQKLFTLQGQVSQYVKLLKEMEKLVERIEQEKNRLSND
jgi:AraC-like DNA-binding protein